MTHKLNLNELLKEIANDAEFERGKKDQLSQAEIRTLFAKPDPEPQKEEKGDE